MASSKKNHQFKQRIYPVTELPEVVIDSFIYDTKIGYCGSKFRRRVQGIGGLVYYHYAFFYGFDNKGILWLIERNEDSVVCISFEDFILEFASCDIEYIENDPNKKEEILKRAREVASKSYKGDSNNCEHFVNYCVFGEHESNQAEITKAVVNTVISIYETLIVIRLDDKGFQILNKSIEDIRKFTNLERPKEIENIIYARKNRKTTKS